MGKVKDSIPDYIDIDDIEALESYAFKQELLSEPDAYVLEFKHWFFLLFL